jgi:3-phenylpropionate/trans-cinnamate dioxygenase ferredoxin subunit
VRPYPVSVEPGDEIVRGPYTAETFPVAVEGEHVVVDLPGGRR